MTEDDQFTPTALRAAPTDVWDAVRDDYLAGMSGPDCCRRHGVSLAALRARASRHGWRRADQPWRPPHALEPWDEGLELEDKINGDMNMIDFGDLPHVASSRMARAILRGDAVGALRWHRVHQLVEQDDEALRRWIETEELRQRRAEWQAERDARLAAEDEAEALAAEEAEAQEARDSVDSVESISESRPQDDDL